MLVTKDYVYVSTAEGLVRVSSDGTSSTLLPTEAPAVGPPALDPVSWTVYVRSGDKLLAFEP